ncbi:MAG: MFS transporter, partial [Treponema sp.]|nr:MFS transporter [Treponema sp.]
MYLIPAHICLSFVYGAVAPFLSILVYNLGYSKAIVGIILALFEGTGIFGPFLLGRLADRHGKYKWCLILALVLIIIPAMPLALFAKPAASAILIAVLAIGFRSTTPLLEAITSINTGATGNYGKIRVTGSIAFVCYVLLMQWIPVLKPGTAWNIAFWMAVTSVFSIIVIAFLPFQTVTQKPAGNDSDGGKTNGSIWTPYLILGLVCIALSRLSMTPAYYFLSLFMIEKMNWNAVGVVWALASLSEIPFLYISSRVIRRFGAPRVLVFSSAMVAVRCALYALFPFKAGIIAAQLLHSFCFGLFHPAAISFISGCVPQRQRSFGMNVYLSLGTALPLFVGNFAGGFIVEYAGYRPLFAVFSV